jgi:hypothetical protein
MIGGRLSASAVLITALAVSCPPQDAQAGTAAATGELPLTHAEQASRLYGTADGFLGEGLLPRTVHTASPAWYFQRDCRQQWLASPAERIRLAERIGNQGRARFAKEHGLVKLLGSQGRRIRQGPDSVYRDPGTGNVVVLEAKGGSSQLNRTFGSLQGTNANTVSSAEFALKSSKTSLEEKRACAKIMVEAQRERLRTGVIRTRHVQGTPGRPELAGGYDATSAARRAAEIEKRLAQRDPELASIFRRSRRVHRSPVAKRGPGRGVEVGRWGIGRGMACVGLVGSAAIGWEAYGEFCAAWAAWNAPMAARPASFCLHTGLGTARSAQALSLGLGSAARLGFLRWGGLRFLGRAAGKSYLPLAIITEGLVFGVSVHDYRAGRIGRPEFRRRATGTAVFVTCTAGGAGIGLFFGGPPGAIVGAGIGTLVALPAQWGADRAWGWHMSRLQEQEKSAITCALRRHYGLSD